MSPKPFVTSQYDDKHPYDATCTCTNCSTIFLERLHARNPYMYGFEARPTERFWRGLRLAIPLAILIWAVLAIGGILLVSSRSATNGGPKPIAAPESLVRARAACPINRPLRCRAALVHAYEAVQWQRHARWGAKTSTSRDVVLDAINWASAQTGVPAWRLANIARCESHLFFLAHNGQYLGVWQLGAMHRSDPIFRVVPWMDPYAQAIHVARFIKAHGESQWQCSSTGGLRW